LGYDIVLIETNRSKLIKQLSLLSSDYQGEQIAALNAIQRTLKSSNATWNDFIQSLDTADQGKYKRGYSDGFQAGCDYRNSEQLYDKARFYQMLVALEKHSDKLNDWSHSFVSNLLENWFRNGNDKRLSQKQCSVIEKMYKQFC